MNVIPLDEERIFYVARRVSDPEAREAYLRQVCGEDAALYDRVDALLRVTEQEASFLEVSPYDATVDVPAPAESPGTVIGLYKLLEVIGEGGMGTVYMAEQTEPVRRRVALKVIKPGMDSKQVVARFESERQALAIMDHPNIARVFDGGMTPEGRPYFVMELVRGLPITEYCDQHQLSIPERLELFILVCRAVQHAHQKGVIHRDLKPSNVLVTVIDGVGVPKIIDFGIAKAAGQALTDKTLFTGFHQFVGTPLYVSPEQAELSGVDVDTRSDIYSLGVLLYELLTGTTPFDSETLKKAAFDEMRRIIREEEPARPSMRLSSLGEMLTSVSAQRRADPRRLGASMKSELDWVVMKALEKDRQRRYETANDFASDVMRYLTDQAVEACPPTAWYRFTKYARRNRIALTTAALVGLALIAGLSASTWQAIRADRARRETQAALMTAEGARRETEAALATARKAVDEMYTEVAEKWLSREGKLTPVQRQFLEKALSFYERFAARQGTDPKIQFAAAAAAIRVAMIQSHLGLYEQAIAANRQALSTLERLAAANPRHRGYWDAIDIARNHLSIDLGYMGKMRESVEESTKAIEQSERLMEQHPDRTSELRNKLAMEQINLGIKLKDSGRIREAEIVLRRSCEEFERQAESEPNKSYPRNNLGFALGNLSDVWTATGRFAEAEAGYKKVLGIFESLQGDNSGMIAASLFDLARFYLKTGRDEALDTNRRALEHYERAALSYPHSVPLRTKLLGCRINEGDILKHLGRLGESEGSLRRAVSEAEAFIAEFPAVPGYRVEAARALACRAEVLRRLDRRREAGEAARRAVAFAERLVAEFPELPEYRQAGADALCEQALTLVGGDRPGGVREAFERALGEAETLAAADPDRTDFRETLARTCVAVAEYHACGAAPEHRDPARAAAAARRAIEVAPNQSGSWAALGLAEYRAGHWGAAIEAAGKSLALCGETGSAYAWTVLALAHGRRGETEIARKWFEKIPPRSRLGSLTGPPLALYDEVVRLLEEGNRARPEGAPVPEAEST